jgi:membrane associated rhomboid family serine protease
MGALLILLWRRKGDVRQLLMWLGLNLIITFVGGAQISWQAHLGGLVGGAILACIWIFVPRTATQSRNQWVALGCLVVLIAVGLVARTLVLTG